LFFVEDDADEIDHVGVVFNVDYFICFRMCHALLLLISDLQNENLQFRLIDSVRRRVIIHCPAPDIIHNRRTRLTSASEADVGPTLYFDI
jgi:hypothetical protein